MEVATQRGTRRRRGQGVDLPLGLLTQYNAMEPTLRGTPAVELHSPREMIGNALRGQCGEMLFRNEGKCDEGNVGE